MNTLAIRRETSQAIALPEPRVPISIRVGTLDDFEFIDALQKKHDKMVGFLRLIPLQNKIKAGHVLIAEEGALPLPLGDGAHDVQVASDTPSPLTPLPRGEGKPVGYCIFQDKYDKHDDVGIFFQVNVVPGSQRGLIGATLVKAALDRAAYGCKLACCWCAQDLEANYFWESLGFVPLAFRTGSRPRFKKDGTVSKPERIHIFWQRRIREGDTETPYWFPAETNNGAVREARIALPIPPGTHWSDAMPSVLPGAVLPGMERLNEPRALASGETQPLPPPEGRGSSKPRPRKLKSSPVPVRPPSRGVWVAPPAPTKEQIAAAKKAAKAKERAERPRMKNDPKLVAAAREVRDRYIEQINAPGGGLLLPPSANGKYDVSRQLEAAPTTLKRKASRNLLEAA